MDYTYSLDEINLNMVSVVGRKSAYLGELRKIGFDVPNGFVISSLGVDEILKGYKEDIESALSSVNLNDISDLEKRSNMIKNIVMNSSIPEEIEKEIYERFYELNSKYVAVRATVTSPLSGASYAGEYETDLFVTKENLTQAIKRVLASYFNPNAIAYRIATKNEAKMAILVQAMINPVVAGTAFSIHPITEEPDYVFIESAFGLGESVTKGIVTPDQYIVSKGNRSIVSKRISEKNKKLIYDFNEKRIKQIELEKELARAESLNSQDAIKVGNLTIGIENIFKRSVNIEWAIEDKKLYVLEVRGVRKIYQEFE